MGGARLRPRRFARSLGVSHFPGGTLTTLVRGGLGESPGHQPQPGLRSASREAFAVIQGHDRSTHEAGAWRFPPSAASSWSAGGLSPCSGSLWVVCTRVRFRLLLASLCAGVLLVVPTLAHAMEISFGLSTGGMLIGADPRFAVSPHGGLLWRSESLALSVHDHVNILPAVNRLGVGLYNQTSAAVGYAWDSGNVILGPTLAIYFMPLCGPVQCGRVLGVGPGIHAQVDAYFVGPVGASLSANLDWNGGSSPLLPGNLLAMLTGGLVVRLDRK